MQFVLKGYSRLSQSLAEIRAFVISAMLGGLGVGLVKVFLIPKGLDSF